MKSLNITCTTGGGATIKINLTILNTSPLKLKYMLQLHVIYITINNVCMYIPQC